MGDPRGVVRRYYVYEMTNAYGFYLPVSVVYLTQVKGYGMEVVGLTGAAFLFAEVAAEIPTGYVGDRIGRRASLAAGNLLSAVALVTVDWSLPFLANALLSALGIPILATPQTVASERDDTADRDTPGDSDPAAVEDETFTVGDALRTLRLQVRRPEIRWFVAFAALLYTLFELSRTFEQPAMTAAGISVPTLGLLYGGSKLVSAARPPAPGG
jgi:MFS family permease